MRRLLGLLAVGGAVGAGVWAARRDPGYLLLRYDGWTVESSLALAVAAVAVAFLLLHLLLRLLARMRRLPGEVRRAGRQRRGRQAQRALAAALGEIAEGHAAAAERRLIKAARHADEALPFHLLVAASAHARDARERRDAFLQLAEEGGGLAPAAAALIQAGWRLERGEHGLALALLDPLLERQPEQSRAHLLAARARLALADWPGLRRHLAQIAEGLGAAEREAMEEALYAGLLDRAAAAPEGNEGNDGLQREWQGVPERWRRDPALLGRYVRHLHRRGAAAVAEPLLREALGRRWDDGLAYLYGVTATPGPGPLRTAEGWLAGHERDPLLLLTLGRLCIANRLWGKARDYLAAAVAAHPRAEGYALLAQVLETMGEHDALRECCREGLRLAADEAPGQGR